MATVMRLAGWKAQGLRCPDHELHFLTAGGDVHAVTLIQIPTGPGKSMMLELL